MLWLHELRGALVNIFCMSPGRYVFTWVVSPLILTMDFDQKWIWFDAVE